MTSGTPLDRIPRSKISTAVRAGLSLFVLGAMGTVANTALAQDSSDDADGDAAVEEDDSVLEEVMVTGFRSVLQSSQDLKRNSDVVMDSVTAEDMGALPDRSVTEALQRIPGVSINRFRAGSDPDHFSPEGSGVVIRGLTYVRSEINGRESFTANNGRGLSFADIAPELLAGVDVVKSLSAERIEGGISGTVNLRTRKPFDSEENVFAFTAQGTYSDFIEETTPGASGLATWRWDTDAGEFGVLASAVYSQIKSRADRFGISNFAERTLYSSGDVIDTGQGETPVKQVYFPRGAVMGSQEFDRERTGYAAAFQWRSPDKSLEATAEFLRSESTEAWTERTIEIATDVVSDDGRDSQAVPGTEFTFDDSDIFDSGYITGPAGWRDDQWSGDPRTPSFGLPSNNIQRQVDQKFVTDDYSLNLKWFVNDEWAVNFDYQHVDSTVKNLDAGIWTATFQNALLDLNGTSLPFVEFTPPELCDGAPSNTCTTYMRPGNERFDDPYNSFYRAAMDHFEDSEGDMDAYRIDVSKIFSGNNGISGIQFGMRYSDRDQTARFSTYNWGVLSEIWGEGGPVWGDEFGGQNLEPFYFDNFFDGDMANPLAGDGRLFYNGDITGDYASYAQYARDIVNYWDQDQSQGQRWVPLPNREGVVPGTWFLPNEINPVREKNTAVYFKLDFDRDLANGWNIRGNVGLRYTDTERTATGQRVFVFQEYATDEECDRPLPPGQSPTAFCTLDPSVRQEARDYSNGATEVVDSDLDYDYWLPSLNVLLQVSEEWQFRGSYFKGIAPPEFGLTRSFFPIELQTNFQDIIAGGGRPISRFDAGNPFLLPTESDNFDLTAEWYFADVGQLTFSLFWKNLENITTNDTRRDAYTNNGATFDAISTTGVNSDEDGEIKGLEIAYQQAYNWGDGWLQGFGLNANYTYVDSSNVPQSTLSISDPDVAAGNQSTVDLGLLPLQGLSEHTVNIQPFWEYDRWSIRMAYSWRSEFLLTIRDVIVPFQPIQNEDTGQLDLSIFFTINDHFKIGLQGSNVTNERITTSAVLNNDLLTAPRQWYMNDSRYTLSLRGNW